MLFTKTPKKIPRWLSKTWKVQPFSRKIVMLIKLVLLRIYQMIVTVSEIRKLYWKKEVCVYKQQSVVLKACYEHNHAVVSDLYYIQVICIKSYCNNSNIFMLAFRNNLLISFYLFLKFSSSLKTVGQWLKDLFCVSTF